MRDDDDVQALVDGAPAYRPEPGPQHQVPATHPVDLSNATLTPAQWAAANIPLPRYALGALIGFDVRTMTVANTGAGKTMFALALAVAAYLGRSFLHWQATGARMRVLFIDAEMPKTLMQQRICAAFGWFDDEPAQHTDGIFFLSRDDFADMPAVDTKEGQLWFSDVIKQLRPDFIFFDNLMALTCLSLKEDEGWQSMKPWLLGLRCGWMLIHHTGHDGTRSYGDKAKEWHLDIVALLQAVEDESAELVFDLSFSKARRRTPENRTDFEKRRIELRQGQWSTSESKSRTKTKLSAGQEIAYRALSLAINREGELVPAGPDVPSSGAVGVPETTWRRYYYQKRSVEDGDKSGRDARSKAFREARDALEANGLAASSVAGWWWIIRSSDHA